MEDSINIISILRDALKHKTKILSLFFLTLFISIIYVKNINNMYQSTSVLKFKDSKNNTSYDPFSSISGLINIPSSSGEHQLSEVIAVLKSKQFFKHVAQKHLYLDEIYAVERYDEKEKELIYDNTYYNPFESSWNLENHPCSKDIYYCSHKKFIDDNFSYSIDKDTGFVELVIHHESPNFAYTLLDTYIVEINDFFKTKAIEVSDQSIDYYTNLLNTNSDIVFRTSIMQTLQEEYTIRKTINVNEYFILEPIIHPYIPIKYSYPNRLVIIFSLSLAVFLISILCAIAYEYVRERDTS